LPGGKTITQPINTDGNLSINFWGGVGFKLKKADLRFNINPNLNYSRFADILNTKTNYSQTTNAGLSVYISKAKEKKYDVSVNNNFSYNHNTTSQNTTVNKFYTNSARIEGMVYYKKVWSLSTDYEYNVRQKTVQFNNNLNNSLWNAKLNRTFKKDEFTAYILVRDILNQNISIERSFYGNTSSETTNDRLKRYFMVGFTWNFKNKGAAAK
jgi:hypothetical protein